MRRWATGPRGAAGGEGRGHPEPGAKPAAGHPAGALQPDPGHASVESGPHLQAGATSKPPVQVQVTQPYPASPTPVNSLSLLLFKQSFCYLPSVLWQAPYSASRKSGCPCRSR